MEKNVLNKYVFDLLESLEKHLSTYRKDKKPKHIHHLRVDIKKINALLSFARYMYQEKYDTSKLKPLFHDAGKIREMQLNVQLLRAVPNFTEKTLTRLEKKEKILIHRFTKKESRYFKLIKYFKKKASLPEILPSKKTIKAYFSSEQKDAAGILEHVDRDGLHRYRKKIKKIMYIYCALPRRMQNEIELNKAEINKLQKKLGVWHDTYSAIVFFSREPISTELSPYIMELKKKEKRQYNRLLTNLTDKLK